MRRLYPGTPSWTLGLAVLGCAAVLLAACSPGGNLAQATSPSVASPNPPASSRATPPNSSPTAPGPAGPGSVNSPPAPASTTPAPAPYTASTTTLNGVTAGSIHYSVTYALLEGGPNASAIDAKIANAVQVNITGLAHTFEEGGSSDEGGSSISADTTSFTELGPLVAAESIDFAVDIPSAAHGESTVSTLVYDLATAQPVTLAQVFTNEQAGLDALSTYTQSVLPTMIPDYNPQFFGSGWAPTGTNFATWQPTPAGMQITFQEYQVGSYADGQPMVTVPWNKLPLSSFALANLTP